MPEPTIYTVEVIEVRHVRMRYAVAVRDQGRGERINRMLVAAGARRGEPLESELIEDLGTQEVIPIEDTIAVLS